LPSSWVACELVRGLPPAAGGQSGVQVLPLPLTTFRPAPATVPNVCGKRQNIAICEAAQEVNACTSLSVTNGLFAGVTHNSFCFPCYPTPGRSAGPTLVSSALYLCLSCLSSQCLHMFLHLPWCAPVTLHSHNLTACSCLRSPLLVICFLWELPSAVGPPTALPLICTAWHASAVVRLCMPRLDVAVFC
jgi:hypothetical protein